MATPDWLIPNEDIEVDTTNTPDWLAPRKYMEELTRSSSFSEIPSGKLVTNTETGEQGLAYPELGQVATMPSPLPSTPKQPQPSNLIQYAAGTKEGTFGLLGMPVDTINMLAGLPFGKTNGLSEQPVGGARSMNALYNKMTGVQDVPQPTDVSGKLSRTLGQFTPGVILPGVGAAKTGAPVLPAIAEGALPTLGAASASTAAQVLVPDSQVANFIATMAGGIGTAVTQSVLKNWANPAINARIDRTLNGVAKLSQGDLGGTDAGSLAQTRQQGVEGVKIITLSNKDKPFTYTDIDGRVTHTGLPRSRAEFSQAIDQMKARIYKTYNTMQREAGQKGLSFSGDNLNTRFEKFLQREDAPPSVSDVAGYMKRQLKKYEGQEFTPQQIENEIAHLNAKLKAYNKNPNPSQTSRATADTHILKILRDELDSGITAFEGPGYSEFKNQYGNIRALQDRVGKAALQQAKEEGAPAKWYDLSEMTAGVGTGTIVAMTHDPMYALVGAGLIGSKRAHKFLMQPDRRITRMFGTAERLVKPSSRVRLENAERPMSSGSATGLTQPYTEGEWQQHKMPLTGGERAGLLTSPRAPGVIDAEWSPVPKQGGPTRGVVTQTSVQDLVPFDYDTAFKRFVDAGMDPSMVHDQLRQEAIRELKRRRFSK